MFSFPYVRWNAGNQRLDMEFYKLGYFLGTSIARDNPSYGVLVTSKTVQP